ncbi:MAG TPA: septum formation initiator family protein [Verrucomicrobiae bacterium]|nr:septum formation initiator family protein [Verrucomicrobiae bacterium]
MKSPLVRFFYLFTVLLIVGYAVVTLRGPRGIGAYLEKQRQIHELEKRNAAMAQEIERKRERLERLSNDPVEQELEIRERLKLVHPKDKVFIIDPQSK